MTYVVHSVRELFGEGIGEASFHCEIKKTIVQSTNDVLGSIGCAHPKSLVAGARQKCQTVQEGRSAHCVRPDEDPG